MVAIKLKNVSVKSGDRFRNNQNYTMTFWKKDGIDENSTVDDIRLILWQNAVGIYTPSDMGLIFVHYKDIHNYKIID